MSRVLLCAAVLLLCSTAAAGAGLPRAGTLVPGRSLGGVKLGETAPRVQALLGSSYGVCRGCARTTWYFTYRKFDRHGLAVELARGRVSAVFTLWQPVGWNAPRGLQLGAVEAQITTLAGVLVSMQCDGYQALVRDAGTTRTAYYVVGGRLWGFGLLHAGESPCR